MSSSFLAKKKFIEAGFPKVSSSTDHVDLCYYGLPLSIHSSDCAFNEAIRKYHPASWQHYQQNAYEFYFLDYRQYFSSHFFEEVDPEFHVFMLKEARVCIQRDFIGWTFDEKRFYFITSLLIDDGYFNCMRWAIPALLIRRNSFVLHSSCFATSDKEAYMFLGPSGAGKSTTVMSMKDQVILGDDMNVVSFNESNCVQSGAIGGQVVYPHFNEKFQLKKMFWLNKNAPLNVTPIAVEDARLKLLGSVANIFFGIEDGPFIQAVLDQVDLLAKKIPMYELSLNKGDTIWPLIRDI